ncbi:flagellar hook-length control protein FliK [uncultured Hyphomicrobium sp.]|uniref:flagellar hook-length control protein FliK n=1 Tax=uncultured Hyphomicrobium sp. TaxID=194373 RepID=UPI0025CF761C|nr:flagellar hook-length control protein FliK [uncultured Hyphomicrobium sp.]
MSAAQALASGLLSASPSVRSSSGASAAERSDTSFRDTLDEASRSNESPERESRDSSAERVGEHSGAGKEETSDGDRDEGRSGDGERVRQPAADVTGAAELSQILAQLSGASASAEEEAPFMVPARTASSDVSPAEVVVEAGPVLPGQTDTDSAPLDTDKLMLLLKSGRAAAQGAGIDKVDVKVTVAGQETHLALAPARADVATMFAGAQDAAPVSAPVEGEEKVVALSAALSQAANEPAKPHQRTRDGISGVEANAKGDAPGAGRAGSIGDQWSQRGGAAFADQGIAGQDGRQSEGRGSSGGGSQQQGTATFMSMLAGASSQAAGTMPGVADAGFGAEPVSDQIAAHVRAELRADGIGEVSSDGVVKVLKIELKPANLGSVTVRIALKNDAVTVHLEAQRHDTLAVIEREREALVGALRSAGYSVEGITAAPQSDASRPLGSQIAGVDSSSSATQGGLSGQASQGQGLGNSAGGQARSGHAGPGYSGQRAPADAKDTNAGGVRRGAEGLYV